MSTRLDKFFTDQGLRPMGTLIHFGIKGQKWGFRRSDAQLAGGKTGTTVTGVKVATDASGKIISTKGGSLTARLDARGMNIKNVPLENADATRARTTMATIKKTKSLAAISDSDLNHLVNRLGLEKRYADVTKTKNPVATTHKTIKTLLGVGKTMNEAVNFARSPTGRLLSSKVGLNKATGLADQAQHLVDLAEANRPTKK